MIMRREFNRLDVLTQLLAGSAAMVVLIVLLGVVAIIEMHAGNNRVSALQGIQLPAVRSSLQMAASTREIALGEFLAVGANTPLDIKHGTDMTDAGIGMFRNALAGYRALASGDDVARVRRVADFFEHYIAIDAKIRAALADGNQADASQQIMGAAAQTRAALDRELEAIVAGNDAAAAREGAAAQAAYHHTILTVAGFILFASLIALIVSLVIARGILRQLGGEPRVAAALTARIAAGDLSTAIRTRPGDGTSLMVGLEFMRERLAAMVEEIQQSSLQLKQKTADIQAMLQNMQQGILTVVDGGIVHPEYSAYLEAILETTDIAGQPLLDLVFDNTDVGSDARAQIEAALDACLGEDSMNFAFNEHLLVNEISKTMADGRVKILDLSWSAIIGENDIVVRLMLCVRDVTELRALATEAGEQRRRLEMIGEILAVSEEKFHQFVESSIGFIHENERIIREHDRPDLDAVAKLFRNMHTVKGNARTYSFQHLTSIVHDAEQRYDALRTAQGDHIWDQQALIADLGRVKAALEAYATINEVSLGRKGGKAASSAERYLMVDIALIQQHLEMLEGADASDPQALLEMRESMHRTLRLLGTETLGEALGGVLGSLPSLAQELGKEVPHVRIDDNGYRVRSQACGVLCDVFTHLLRNCVDHGIEPADERIAAGKPAPGTIALEMGVDDHALQITVSDDGRGLALAKIRRAAIERGWLSIDEAASDETIAAFIFRPGFSTAQTVSEVSGRGVGMDAVRDFIRREHGRIELRFTDDRQGADFRSFQTVAWLPETWTVDSFGEPDRAQRRRGDEVSTAIAG